MGFALAFVAGSKLLNIPADCFDSPRYVRAEYLLLRLGTPKPEYHTIYEVSTAERTVVPIIQGYCTDAYQDFIVLWSRFF